MNAETKQAIVIDFDHCIFNTTKLVGIMQDVFLRDFGIDRVTFMEHRQKIKDCCVVIDIDRFVQSLPHKDKAGLHATIHDILKDNAASCVFPDVFNFVKRHQDEFDIIISTHGDQELQSEKIKHSNLPESVQSHISIQPKDNVIGSFMQTYKKVHFIDDKAKNIDLVKKTHPQVITYFIKRPEDSPYADEPSSCDCADYVITNLKDLQLS